jgi:membrane protease YdiL (CAAX protease family)
MMLASSFFPLSDHSRSAFTSVMLLPWIGALNHVLIGPLLEEIVYRGGALPLARRYMPVWAAVIATSVLFGATHFAAGSAAVCMATLMGVVFASFAVRFGSILPGLICHMAFNFTAGFIVAPSFDIAARLSEVPPGGSVAGSMGLILPLWWIAASLALAGVAVMFLRRAARATNGR